MESSTSKEKTAMKRLNNGNSYGSPPGVSDASLSLVNIALAVGISVAIEPAAAALA
tara:strand:+ start:241001 stop:241168 length:168 start_codon:yes stop_codon:yes gene_type:complete